MSGVMLQHYDTQGTVMLFGISPSESPTPDSFTIPDDPKTMRELATALNEQADYMDGSIASGNV